MQKKKKKLFMILGGVLVLALCVGLFLFFSLNRFSRSTPSTYYPSVPIQPSQKPAAQPEGATPPGPVQDISKDLPELDNDVTDVPELPKADRADIEAELKLLLDNRPELMIECTSCGGTGRETEDCPSCFGQGHRIIPGGFGIANCPSCNGLGHQRCRDCAFGSMKNPNYEAEQEAWTERRHELWRQLGYSDAEIRRMEIDEAKAALGDGGGDVVWNSGSGDFIEIDTPPGICKVCSGTGKCPTCGGDRRYMNPFTGEQQTCPNCTDGLCWNCGGSKTS